MKRPLLNLALAAALVGSVSSGRGLTVTGYDPVVNARFSSGWSANPVPNTSPTSVVDGLDPSGIGWGANSPNKGFGFITPQHYLVARHFGGDSSIRLLGGDGQLHTYSQQSVEITGTGLNASTLPFDLSLGTLTTSVATTDRIARYGVLDLNPTSTNNGSYNGQTVLLYGRGAAGPVFGETTINGTSVSGSYSAISTSRDDAQFVSGDSGSPTFIPWTNPNGGRELTIVGNNSAIGSDANNVQVSNISNFLGSAVAINAVNALIIDEGRALRVVGTPTSFWQPTPTIITDTYALFDAANGAPRTINVGNTVNLRGYYFKSTVASGDNFSFSGAGTLEVGRGGITNYDADRQIFNVNLRLTDHQYWDGGPGGITAAALDTNGKLLEIHATAAAAARITGVISGAGGIALDDGKLELSGASTYTGTTWVHAGELRVDGNIASSAAARLGSEGTLSGVGTVGLIAGSGTVGPGASPGILTASQVDPSGGLDFAFEFTTLGNPTFSNASASGNDLLRLTSGTPFTGAFTSANVISIYLDLPSLTAGDSFRGGFFTDTPADFLGSLLVADFQYYVADAGGPFSYLGKNYSSYGGPLGFALSTTAVSADFAAGTVAGRILNFSTLTPVPEPLSWAALGILLALGAALRRRV